MLEFGLIHTLVFGLAFLLLPGLFIGAWIYTGIKRLCAFRGELKKLDEQECRARKMARTLSGDRADQVLAEELQRRAARRSKSVSDSEDDECDDECDALAAQLDARS